MSSTGNPTTYVTFWDEPNSLGYYEPAIPTSNILHQGMQTSIFPFPSTFISFFPLPDSDILILFYSFHCHDFGRLSLRSTVHSLFPTPTWEHAVFIGILYFGKIKTWPKVGSRFAEGFTTARFLAANHVIRIWLMDKLIERERDGKRERETSRHPFLFLSLSLPLQCLTHLSFS